MMMGLISITPEQHAPPDTASARGVQKGKECETGRLVRSLPVEVPGGAVVGAAAVPEAASVCSG